MENIGSKVYKRNDIVGDKMREDFCFNKIFGALTVILFFGTVSVFAGDVLVSEEGLVSTYFSSSGNVGVTQNVSCEDGSKVFVIEDGIIVFVDEDVGGDGEAGNGTGFPFGGLVSYYSLDVDASDDYGSNDGTVSGASLTSGDGGKLDEAYDFEDSLNERIEFTHAIDTATANPFSITGWINPNDFTGSDKICGQDALTTRGFQIYVDTLDQITIYNGLATIWTNTGVTLSVGNWYFFAITYDGDGTMQIIVNNMTQEKTSVTFQIDTTHAFYLGFDGRNAYGDMKIDEVGIWDRVLNSTEISNLYNNGEGLAYNNYENTSGTTIEEKLIQLEEQVENLTIKIISLEDETSETSSGMGDVEDRINSLEGVVEKIKKFITESLPAGLGKRFVD
jgi:Concanavalin A-like lectin/glucanases superfamily